VYIPSAPLIVENLSVGHRIFR